MADTASETVTDGAGEVPSGDWNLKRGEASSGVATEDDDGDGGCTIVD